MSDPIIVVGAGLSGLYAAFQLQNAGHRVILIEARARTGGRILSEGDSTELARVDLGATWYWPAINPQFSSLIHDFNLQTFPQYNIGMRSSEFHGGEIRQFSSGQSQNMESRRISGGLSSLVEKLQRSLSDVTLMFNTTVASIRLLEHAGVELSLVCQGEHQLIRGSKVLMTIPPRLLAQNIAADPPWPANLLQKWNKTATWMAPHAKFIATYDKPFWREAGFSGTASSEIGPMVEIHDASDMALASPALFGFIGYSSSQRSKIGEAELQQQAITQLGRLFGLQALHPRWIRLQDWSAESNTAAKLDQYPLSHHPIYQAPELPAEWRERLFLAGTEFAPMNGGFLEGALEAASHAVSQVLSGIVR